jgi:hypothetical protein
MFLRLERLRPRRNLRLACGLRVTRDNMNRLDRQPLPAVSFQAPTSKFRVATEQKPVEPIASPTCLGDRTPGAIVITAEEIPARHPTT